MEPMQGNSPESVTTCGTDDERCCLTHQPSCHSSKSLLTEEKMRRKLQFFFMNPIEKWQAKKRFPYKFTVQLIKIILVTMQLCLFAYNRYNHVNYTWDNRISFSHLFLRGWDATREVSAYPPATGPLAIYKADDFYATIDYAYSGYANLSQAVGSYSYANEDNTMTDMELCLSQYKKGIIFGFNESYVFDAEIVDTCLNITHRQDHLLDSKQYLDNLNINFSALVKAVLKFSVKTVNFKTAGRISPPNCYRFDININFDNEDHDGQMLLWLDAQPVRLMCKGDVEYVTDDEIDSLLQSLLNYLVITICILSFVLCTRALLRAQKLKKMTNSFFINQFGRPLSKEDRNKFLNLWYVMIIINDILIIIGSSIKEQIERKDFTSDQWNVCSLFLGLGNMLVWFGVLRYLTFFKTYNVVILTLEKAAPQVARFLLCALLIYAGFTFSGWLILGPYHLKFRSLSTTSECLFSLINGDDMFATFSIMSSKSTMLWWFSKIYLYSFISLYIYIILSLFISVIMDAYDTIKIYYIEGFPKSDLQIFIGDTNFEDVSSGIFRTASNDSLGGLMKDLCCCTCTKLQKSYSSLSRGSLATEGSRRGSNAV
ncbi:mucolipin-3 [Tribolium castaneum]|uniref:TRPL n=1 Tax=Tribolium castaneum TaxID=7070 RepID=D6WWW5_TRICA|nr:PREDICTED: mucolipin-3 [Tribolium castaneum]EFA09175.1 TRPL [Tribolium castaneum]|eukprot:XP_966660.1 PREDICTED: mucolipin-3 [Tribolium castaneum]